jgi:hypothetical protein
MEVAKVLSEEVKDYCAQKSFTIAQNWMSLYDVPNGVPATIAFAQVVAESILLTLAADRYVGLRKKSKASEEERAARAQAIADYVSGFEPGMAPLEERDLDGPGQYL